MFVFFHSQGQVLKYVMFSHTQFGLSRYVSQVFKLLTDLKEQRKDGSRNKHSIGQQNLNTIMYEVGARLFSNLLCKTCTFAAACPRFSLYLRTDAEVLVKHAL